MTPADQGIAAAKLDEYRRQHPPTGKLRRTLMRDFAAKARAYDRHGDTVLRTQVAQAWRELATDAEARRAPRYLTWHGRTA